LDDALSLEYGNLKQIEDAILAVSMYISEIEKAGYFSLHKISIEEGT
jgi:hypothetical protein